jgi:hypothetical protein
VRQEAEPKPPWHSGQSKNPVQLFKIEKTRQDITVLKLSSGVAGDRRVEVRGKAARGALKFLL